MGEKKYLASTKAFPLRLSSNNSALFSRETVGVVETLFTGTSTPSSNRLFFRLVCHIIIFSSVMLFFLESSVMFKN
jgi:hypothetical protein